MAEIKITVDINSAIRNVGRLDGAFDEMNTGAVKADRNVGNVDDAINKAGREVDDFGKESVQAFAKVDGGLDDIGVGGIAMGNILADAFSKVAESAGRAIRVMVETGADFEQQMAKVRAISGATEAEFTKLEETARELGATTQFSAGQAASGLQFLAQAGFETEESIAALPGILSVAAAAGSDLGETADIVSNALSGFNLEADETNTLGDVITKTFTSSNTTLQSLGESFRVIAPIANSFGISVEETAAAIGRLGDAGIQGSIAGTQLRGALSRLAKPTGDAADVIEELNIQTTDAQGNFLSLPELVGQFERGLQGLTQAERQNALATVVGQEALSSFSVLLQAGQDDLEGYTAQLRDSEGAAESVAKTQNDTLQGSFNRLQSAVDELSIALFDRFGGAIRSVTDGFTNFVSIVSDFLALPASEKIEEERIGLNSLALQLAQTNKGEERRGDLIAEINQKYPSFLQGLTDETLSNEKLKERLDDVNAAYLRKIAIKTQEERIEKATRQALQAGREEQEARTDALNRLREVNERYGLGLDLVNDSIEDNIQKARERLGVSAVEQTDQRGRIIAQNAEAKALDSLSSVNTQVASTTKTAGDRQAELNKIISDANEEIEKLLGNQKELNESKKPEGGSGDVSVKPVEIPVKPTFDLDMGDFDPDAIIKDDLVALDLTIDMKPALSPNSIAFVKEQNRQLQEQLTNATTQGERDRLNAAIQANNERLANMRSTAEEEVFITENTARKIGDALGGIVSSYAKINRSTDKRIAKIKEQKQEELSSTSAQIKAKIREAKTEEEREKLRKQLSEKRAEINISTNKKIAEAEEQASQRKKEAIAETISAVTAEIVAKAVLGAFTANPILGLILAPIAAAAAQALVMSVIPGFATGVTAFEGGTALVGEEGPELVTLGKGSNVITNENTNKLIDAGVVDTGTLSVNAQSTPTEAENISQSDITEIRNVRNVKNITDAGTVSANVTSISEAQNRDAVTNITNDSDSFNTGQMSAPVYSITETDEDKEVGSVSAGTVSAPVYSIQDVQSNPVQPINVQGGRVQTAGRINTQIENNERSNTERLNSVTREVGNNLNGMAGKGQQNKVDVSVEDIVLEGEQLRIVLQNNDNLRKVAGIA